MSDPQVTEKIAVVDLAVAKRHAQNMLDGMAVPKERMARDHMDMARELAMWREKYAEIAGKVR